MSRLDRLLCVLSSAQSQGTVGSSQDSNMDGLSPDMSDYDHSNEAEPEPREIKIRKGNSSLGRFPFFLLTIS